MNDEENRSSARLKNGGAWNGKVDAPAARYRTLSSGSTMGIRSLGPRLFTILGDSQKRDFHMGTAGGHLDLTR